MSEDSRYVREIMPDVQSVAKSVAREWDSVVEAEDVEQEIWLRLLGSSEVYLGQTAVLDRAARVALLNKIGHQVAVNYRDDYEAFSGNHKYGSPQVKRILESGVLRDSGAEGPGSNWSVGPEIKTPSSNPETDTLSEIIDLNNGLADLYRKNGNYWATLVEKYRDDVGVVYDNAGRMTLSRAVDALTASMNNYHRRRVSEYVDGPGSREVVDNEDAQRKTKGDYRG